MSEGSPGTEMFDDAELAQRTVRLRANHDTFQTLVSEAKRLFDRGRPDAAAVRAQVAASFAFFHHPGVWASAELEELLISIGHRLPVNPSPRNGTESTRRVLHVLTRVAAIGGHSRMVWRWIDQDDSRSHSVVLTRQGALPIPSELHDATRRRNGDVRTLNRTHGTVLSWAASLREMALDADLVVLHIFAEDVVPMIAFADRSGLPPVAFVDQADHAFSLGPAVSDLYIGLRETGIELAVERRGVRAGRVARLPITLPALEREHSRADARSDLELPIDATIMLSIARGTKFAPYRGDHYSDMFRNVIDRNPTAMLIVVGAENDDTWTRTAKETGGRIRRYPERPDTKLFYESADIYVDSFPTNSNTSLLEAGLHSLPLVSRCLHSGPHTIMCAGAFGLEGCIFQSSDRGEVTAELDRLLNDSDLRADIGSSTRAAILGAHVGAAWQAELERLYDQARSVPPIEFDGGSYPDMRAEIADLVWRDLFGSDVSLDEIRTWYIKGLPIDLRVREWFDITTRQRRIRPQLLVPEWMTAQARLLRARALR